MRDHITHFTRAVINSYAILFFSQNKVLGIILLIVSFFNITAGLAGLGCTLFAVVYTTMMGYNRKDIQKGLFSFNALLLGIGFGTFYHVNQAFIIWLATGCLLCIIVTINFNQWLTKYGVPFLSLPFIISFWVLFSAANSVFQMGLDQKSSSILNEFVSASSMTVVDKATDFIPIIHLPYYVELFFRALSAILFQNNVLAGVLIGLGILIHSRIAFSVGLLGFITACLFNAFSGTYVAGVSYYHLGSNFMMTTMAVGSFFLVPSFRSYLWAVVTVPVAFMVVNATTQIVGLHDLPVLSFPFCMVTILLLCFFKFRKDIGKSILTPLQHYSPEKNLYQYLNGEERLFDFKYFNIKLPFMGSWFVSQGYGGTITHKGDWGQALDFVIHDDDHKTYRYPGTRAEDFYCFGKPVLACGDGVVEELIDHIDDNEIGDINAKDNWGNSIVIRHTGGLYSKVSHLKKNSAKVKYGDFVKQGDIIGLCGNSGRSPEPHLHFQLQATAYIGSKTLAYPFSYYISQLDDEKAFNSYQIPQEGMVVKSLSINSPLKRAFNFQPGAMVKVVSGSREEIIEVQTDDLNQTYLYSRSTRCVAYFINNGTSFYFTAFYGNHSSLLYFFYLAAYKVVFTDDADNSAADVYPLQLLWAKPIRWVHDFVAPFYQFIKLNYQSNNQTENEKTIIHGKQYKTVFRHKKQTMHSTIMVEHGSIQGFRINFNGVKVEAECIAENTY